RLLATADNPRGYPDVVVERAGQDTLGTSTFLARPFTGAVVFVEPSEGRRFSFYAPNVWMHGKRVLFPTFAVLGSHLSNAHQAEACARLVDAGALAVHSPEVHAWDDLAEANQALHENRHAGTLTVRVGATEALDTARAAWAQRLFTRIGRMKAPVISAVDGYALGGGNELQMACAWRVAGARAELGQPEINLHVIPGFGGTQMLPRLAARRARVVGGQMYTLLVDALAILLDGRRRSAARAHAVGVVDEVAPADALSHALGVARRLVTGEFSGVLFSPLADGATLAFPNVERDPEIARPLAHPTAVPRSGPAAAILEAVRVGLTEGVQTGLALEAR